MTQLLRGDGLTSATYPGLTDALANEQPGKAACLALQAEVIEGRL